MTILSIPEVLRHAADNVEKGREWHHGIERRCPTVNAGNWISASFGSIKPEVVAVYSAQQFEYRLSPKTITIPSYVQPEPLRVALEHHAEFWYLEADGDSYAQWIGSDWQLAALARGNIFATKEDAQAADAARLAAFKGATSCTQSGG